MRTLPDLLRAVHAARARGDDHAVEAALAGLHAALTDALPTDPLLAASCLSVIDDPALVEALARRARGAQTAHASARALVVDETGRGEVVEVVVALTPGGLGAWTPLPVARDADTAAQLAVAAALGAEADRWSVRWQVRGPSVTLRGSSLGLALAVAVTAARRGVTPPDDLAFTGGVDLDGRVVAVSAVPAKLRAAKAAGLAGVLLPAGTPGPAPPGLAVVHVPDLASAVGVLPAPARTTPVRWARAAGPGALVAVVLLALLGVPDVLDAALQPMLLRAVRAPLPATQTALLPLPREGDLRALRADYPAVIAALKDAGATAVAFDLVFSASDPADAAFAKAIAASGLPVVGAARLGPDGPVLAPDPLAGVLTPGLAAVEADLALGLVRRAPSLRRTADDQPVWHLAIAALGAHLDAAPLLQGERLQLGITRHQLTDGSFGLAPVAPPPVLAWDAPETWEAARGRVVIVGVAGGARDWLRTPAGPAAGAAVHAALIETLAAQQAPWSASALGDATGALAVGSLTAWLRRRTPAGTHWLAALPWLLAIVLVAVGHAVGPMASVVTPFLAAAAGLFAARRA